MNFVIRNPVFELANWMTLVRLPLGAALWIRPRDMVWIFVVLSLAALSDMLDGRVAIALRTRRVERGDDLEVVGRSHAVGAWLDPLCDKTLVLSALLVVYVTSHPPVWMLFAIASRELLLIPCAIAYRASSTLRRTFRFDFRAGALGKLATVAQFGAIVGFLVETSQLIPIVIATGILGAAAALLYLRKAVRFARWLANNTVFYQQWHEMQIGRGRGYGARFDIAVAREEGTPAPWRSTLRTMPRGEER